MGFLSRSLLAAAGLASATSASLASFTPITSGPTYQVGVPTGSSISSTSPGTIYFSLSAPTTYDWVGLGIGTAMAGATIFAMYADGNNNVTVSARDGNQGEVEPVADSKIQSGITLLEGTGVSNGIMTAYVKCTTCVLQSSATSTSSPWICAWHMGSAVDSTSLSYTLMQHNFGDHRQFTFDLSAATLASDTNPFVTAATSTSPSSPTSTPSTGDPSSNTGSTTVGPSAEQITKYQKAHGTIMALTVVLLFPLGASYMRLLGSPLIHSAIQLFSIACLIAGFGLGVHLAKDLNYLYKAQGKTHTTFGTVIFALFLVQPFGGLLHHYMYKKTGSRSAVSHLHIWFGRIIMLLGIVNGGLGLKLADNTRAGKIVYGVVAGVVGVSYIAFVLVKRKSQTPFKLGNRGEKGLTETESPKQAASA